MTLQRPPPEIRTLASGCAVASHTVTRAAGFRSAQVIAAKKPAAPPPAQADFLYGGQPPQYGLTGGQPAMPVPPPNPYGAPASRAVLTGAAGTYAVGAGIETRIGRDPSQCQIVLGEARTSGLHATLKLEGGQLWVRDENSNNGTWLGGARLAPGAWTPVPAGSSLRVGPVEFGVRLE